MSDAAVLTDQLETAVEAELAADHAFIAACKRVPRWPQVRPQHWPQPGHIMLPDWALGPQQQQVEAE